MTTQSAVASNRQIEAILNELKSEAETTRRVLERVPAEKFNWKPHEKSMEMGRLASHVAEMFKWTPMILNSPELDFAKAEYKPFEPQSNQELIGFFEQCLAEAVESLKTASDEALGENWTLRNGETVYFTMPKSAVIRTMVLNHIFHHRGQLSVYLRLNDIPVPSIYGPSADEGNM
ncbi:MAG TPA: DinB family protein [Pyrinomonadaceae bacterium]|nr:DinB family protein [Pyrinomonadaceae bacterium]